MCENTKQVIEWNIAIANLITDVKAQMEHNKEAVAGYIEKCAGKSGDLFVLGMTLAVASMNEKLDQIEHLNDLISNQI
jgi:geranylgeranyl pyrophosphate synthase